MRWVGGCGWLGIWIWWVGVVGGCVVLDDWLRCWWRWIVLVWLIVCGGVVRAGSGEVFCFVVHRRMEDWLFFAFPIDHYCFPSDLFSFNNCRKPKNVVSSTLTQRSSNQHQEIPELLSR